MAYSIDLRRRVVDSVNQEKQTQQATATRFQISLATVKRWLKLTCLIPKKTGSSNARTLDRTLLLATQKANPSAYLDELATLLGSKKSTISYNLIKLGISRKKNHAIQRAK
jgi:transposase